MNLFAKDPVLAADAATTPLFRDLSKTNKKAPLVYKDFLIDLRALLASIENVDPVKYGLHSLRIGGAATSSPQAAKLK